MDARILFDVEAALKVSEGIALERENLVLELQQLKELNKQLLDEKDELVQTAVQLIPARKSVEKMKPTKVKQLDLIEEESMENAIPSNAFSETAEGLVSQERLLTGEHPLSFASQAEECSTYSDSDFEPGHLTEYEEDETEDNFNIRNNLNIPSSKGRNNRKQNVYRSSIENNTTISKHTNAEKKPVNDGCPDSMTAPSRVFKVVFVGDSGVGKTSILQRFCTDDFKATFNATVGIDFQVKTTVVEGERIALQLWDTAGQERFRSLTQQYFRKADGIIVVYDVTVETTFKNVRNWMYLIEEGIQGTVAILLIGNKVDLCESDDDRVIRAKDGERMADEFGALFYETSAKTGDSIKQAIDALASVLKAKEDEVMEEILKLEAITKAKRKKGCCR